MDPVDPNVHAAERFSETLERKWAREREQRHAAEQAGAQAFAGTVDTTSAADDEVDEDAARWDNNSTVEAIEAHKGGERCNLCHHLIVVGDAIVTADGVTYTHRQCAIDDGWQVDTSCECI